MCHKYYSSLEFVQPFKTVKKKILNSQIMEKQAVGHTWDVGQNMLNSVLMSPSECSGNPLGHIITHVRPFLTTIPV